MNGRPGTVSELQALPTILPLKAPGDSVLNLISAPIVSPSTHLHYSKILPLSVRFYMRQLHHSGYDSFVRQYGIIIDVGHPMLYFILPNIMLIPLNIPISRYKIDLINSVRSIHRETLEIILKVSSYMRSRGPMATTSIICFSEIL
jgi:hypothetical protein